MKLLTIILSVLLSCTVCAQNPLFVRIYNESGKQLYKGNVLAVTDSSMLFKRKNIPVQDIYLIKTKRSGLSNIVVGSIVGGAIFATIFAFTLPGPQSVPLLSPTYQMGEAILMGLIVGVPIGAGIGALTIPSKHSKSYIINGDTTNWKAFQVVASKKYVK